MDAILRALGFAPTFRYEKYRAEWSDGTGQVVLDETPIGNFGEIEGPSRWIDRTARALGITPAYYITQTYAELFFAWKHATGSRATEMTFRALCKKSKDVSPPRRRGRGEEYGRHDSLRILRDFPEAVLGALCVSAVKPLTNLPRSTSCISCRFRKGKDRCALLFPPIAPPAGLACRQPRPCVPVPALSFSYAGRPL